MNKPLGPLARKQVAEREGRTLISGAPGKGRGPRDVTDLGIRHGFLPAAAGRLGPGDRQIEIVKGVMGKVPGRHNTKAIDADDPYR